MTDDGRPKYVEKSEMERRILGFILGTQVSAGRRPYSYYRPPAVPDITPMAAVPKSLASCLFCKIIKGEIPSYKLLETDSTFSFLDIGPLARGHALIIPKYHAAKLHELPDESLTDVLLVAKKIALAIGAENYNILQNNGRIAHQLVDHVHFHVIPKPAASDDEGLVVGWPTKEADKDDLAELQKELLAKLAASKL